MEKDDLALTESHLNALSNSYHDLAKQALYEESYEIDVQAALRAPAVFLRDPSNFEATFDIIIHHLNEAYRKCESDAQQRIVSRIAEELYNSHIYVIQQRIDYALSKNKRNLLRKIREFLPSILRDITTLNPKLALIKTGPDVANLLVDYLDYLSTKWMIEKKEDFFYNQLANVYQKIIDSECFDPNIGLVRNTFLRNKDAILTHIVMQKGLVAAMNLTKYDKTDEQIQDSSRVISRALIEKKDWENLRMCLSLLNKHGIANYFELKKEALQAFKEYLADNYKYHKNIIKGKFLISFLVTIIAFLGTIYYKFASDVAATGGFWNSVLHFFSLSLSSFFLSIIISLCAFGGTYLLLFVLNKALVSIKNSKLRKEFERQLSEFDSAISS
ncbi:MAG: hypothetical protein KBG12_06030 [Syntrophobacterales bacterium]|nr:hypothetical protein [Syntrophobacterales bacterium]